MAAAGANGGGLGRETRRGLFCVFAKSRRAFFGREGAATAEP